MTASEHLGLRKVKRGEVFGRAKNGKYAGKYLAALG